MLRIYSAGDFPDVETVQIVHFGFLVGTVREARGCGGRAGCGSTFKLCLTRDECHPIPMLTDWICGTHPLTWNGGRATAGQIVQIDPGDRARCRTPAGREGFVAAEEEIWLVAVAGSRASGREGWPARRRTSRVPGTRKVTSRERGQDRLKNTDGLSVWGRRSGTAVKACLPRFRQRH